MSKKYLRQFDVGFDFPDISRDSEGAWINDDDRSYGRLVGSQLRRLFLPVRQYTNSALQKAKLQIGPPPIEVATVMLLASPRMSPYFDPSQRFLNVDVDYDPQNLLQLPVGARELGELAIHLTTEALHKLKDIPEFPCDLIARACEEFRTRGYAYNLEGNSHSLPGTKIKTQLHLQLSCAGIKRSLIGSYRGKVLFQKLLSETESQNVHSQILFSGLILEGTRVTVLHNQFNQYKDGKPVIFEGYANELTRFDLMEFPEVLDLMRKKGWLER